MDRDHRGWIVVARDKDNDEFARRFVVNVSNPDAATMLVAQMVPEKSCLPERPIDAERVSELGLKPGEYKELLLATAPRNDDGE
jgi:hypothetical protein